jgi:predicted nucleic acid-binding protein
VIILDTNVVSELMKVVPELSVRAWAGLQRRDQLVTTAVTVMELRSGVENLLHSKRRRELDTALDWALEDLLGNRVLNFDRRAAFATGRWHAYCQRIGRIIQTTDAQIAGIAISRNMPIATRDIHDFAGIAVKLINPWDAPA